MTRTLLLTMALGACGQPGDPAPEPTATPTPVPFDTAVPQDPVTRTVAPRMGDDLDLLFVINDSAASTYEEMIAIGPQLGPLEALVQALRSVHVGVITTDTYAPARSGRLFRPRPSDPLYLTETTPDLATRLGPYLQVGMGGAIDEMGRRAVEQALTEPVRTGFNAGFRRDGADLALIFVSDQNDPSGSNPSLAEFRGFLGLEAQGGRITAHAMVGPADGSCRTSDPGLDYLSLVQTFGGATVSLCDIAAYGGFLTEVVRIATPTHDQVSLDDRPVEETVSVSFELDRQVFEVIPFGGDCPGGGCTTWRLDGPPPTLRFDPPIPGRASLEITYTPR